MKLSHGDIENWNCCYIIRQKTFIESLFQVCKAIQSVSSLQSVADCYYTVCQELKSVSSITKCDRLLSQSLCQVLQKGTAIAKWNITIVEFF